MAHRPDPTTWVVSREMTWTGLPHGLPDLPAGQAIEINANLLDLALSFKGVYPHSTSSTEQ
jgi:hypothetical protein